MNRLAEAAVRNGATTLDATAARYRESYLNPFHPQFDCGRKGNLHTTRATKGYHAGLKSSQYGIWTNADRLRYGVIERQQRTIFSCGSGRDGALPHNWLLLRTRCTAQ